MTKNTPGHTSRLKTAFFIQFMLFFGAIATFTVGTNMAMGLDFSFNYKWIATALFVFALAAAAHRGYHHAQVLRLGVYGSAFALFPMAWLSSAGLVSPSIVYAALLIVLINYLLTGRERLATNALFILQVMGLITAYYLQPGLFATLTPEQQLADWLINVPIVFAFLAFLLTRFERAYERARQKNLQRALDMERLSVTDPLTGLYNRLELERRLDNAMSRFQRTREPVTVLFVDIDHFKLYNDYYGHGQGDTCLVKIAELLRAALLRDTDTAFRIGGEEFVILLEGADLAGGQTLAARLGEHINAAALPHAASPGVRHITASIGVAACTAETDSSRELLRAADAALYQAKASGRNRVMVAEEHAERSTDKPGSVTRPEAVAGARLA
ncbi:GGDEF domain-containing protein [Aquisalimonas sp. 2447]|uniref:GGDEF domain-containing protein n=1 Tax=Aquisalimonas sp. 2447 TaxID=2740807 RepID=UPI00143274C7|nr:diguanylate cyclase [Aquisalimonas sp. 2447]QIT55743.1 GGDEF domain-containing protein [Aquisalimonas sp. 2447]